MKTIPLTQGQFAMVDDSDYERLSQWKWFAYWDKHTESFYAGRQVRVGSRQRTMRMHREILDLGFGDKRQGDHINRNTLDYRRDNLRTATPHQNAMNQRKRRDNTSGFKGVYWREGLGKWVALIRHDYKLMHLGVFSDPISAHAAYAKAALKYRGEFASV